jgi:hypothetical protein
MATAKRVQPKKISYEDVLLRLSHDEARILRSLVGGVVGSGYAREVTTAIWTALSSANVESLQPSPFEYTTVRTYS